MCITLPTGGPRKVTAALAECRFQRTQRWIHDHADILDESRYPFVIAELVGGETPIIGKVVSLIIPGCPWYLVNGL